VPQRPRRRRRRVPLRPPWRARFPERCRRRWWITEPWKRTCGAATHYYRRLRFAGGRFSEELLGYKDNEACFIGGEAVDAAKFDAWVEELMAGEALWYAPTGELLGEKEG